MHSEQGQEAGNAGVEAAIVIPLARSAGQPAPSAPLGSAPEPPAVTAVTPQQVSEYEAAEYKAAEYKAPEYKAVEYKIPEPIAEAVPAAVAAPAPVDVADDVAHVVDSADVVDSAHVVDSADVVDVAHVIDSGQVVDVADEVVQAKTDDDAVEVDVTKSAVVERTYALLSKSTLDEVRSLEALTRKAQAAADPSIIRRQALDTLMRSEEEAHEIIESAQRDAASQTTRAELKAKVTLDQARERADLLIASAHARSEMLVDELRDQAERDMKADVGKACDAILEGAKADASAKVQLAGDEARRIIERAQQQATEVIGAAEEQAEERRRAAADMYLAIENLERKVEQDAKVAAEAAAQAMQEVLVDAHSEAAEIRASSALIESEAQTHAEVIVRNAHFRAGQIVAGANETATWFADRVQAREALVRQATEAHASDLLSRAETTSLELLVDARARCNEMIAQAQDAVDRMLAEGRCAAQDLVGGARGQAAASDGHGAGDSNNLSGMWNQTVNDEALETFLEGVDQRSSEVFSQ